jgi:hypothetical protein
LISRAAVRGRTVKIAVRILYQGGMRETARGFGAAGVEVEEYALNAYGECLAVNGHGHRDRHYKAENERYESPFWQSHANPPLRHVNYC